jgi:hypothetical protein
MMPRQRKKTTFAAPEDAINDALEREGLEPLPQNLEAEQCTLAGCLLHEGAAAEVFGGGLLTPGEFYRQGHRTLATIIADLAAAGDPIGRREAVAELEDRNLLETLDGVPAEYVDHLCTHDPYSVVRTKRMAAKVRECAQRRQFVADSYVTRAMAVDTSRPFAEILAEAQARVAAIRPAAHGLPPLRTLEEIGSSLTTLSWVWPEWVPRGYLSLIVAPAGAGKSYVSLALGGILAAGGTFPDGHQAEPGRVMICDYEGAEAITCERARALGLPLDRIFMPDPEDLLPLHDPEGIARLRGWVGEHDIDWLFVDSWRHAIGAEVEDASETAITCGMPLVKLARDFGCGCTAIHHTRKVMVGNSWQLNMDSSRGSSALAGIARSIVGVEKPDASDKARRLSSLKLTVGSQPSPLGFTIGDGGQLDWGDAPQAVRPMPAQDAATELVKLAIRNTPRRYSELEAALASHKLSESTLRRTIKAMAKKGEIAKGSDGRWGMVARGFE